MSLALYFLIIEDKHISLVFRGLIGNILLRVSHLARWLTYLFIASRDASPCEMNVHLFLASLTAWDDYFNYFSLHEIFLIMHRSCKMFIHCLAKCLFLTLQDLVTRDVYFSFYKMLFPTTRWCWFLTPWDVYSLLTRWFLSKRDIYSSLCDSRYYFNTLT